MSKSEIKELTFMVICSILNICIAFVITNLLGITNIVVIKSISVIYGDVTWEGIIFMGLMLIEALIYDSICNNKSKVYSN